ncbi:hypothetical protein RFI_17475 [Reticulomyxa filosa]|uniref:Dynein heavy chain n=1 Tax=Reticulomyxa filosa TaxID=46433 RepID=X6N364_RETFI|nr:hypothetical protein RFI_17475 [Reticulomyxa filosa]|eukprot:ETO19752.1 hypothetical protein RFI_17475 [Reticulomyxa filosa]
MSSIVHWFVGAVQRTDELKKESNGKNKSHLPKGIEKLQEATLVVDKLSQQASQQQTQLQCKQKEADEALEDITKAISIANERKEQVNSLQVQLEKEEKMLSEQKKRIEFELSMVQPLVEESKKAVGNIKKDSLNELRMLRMAPEAIHDVLSGVLLLMGNFDTTWGSVKNFLSKSSVKDEIMHLDLPEKIRQNPQILVQIEQLLTTKKESFDSERIKRVSLAAAPLASWVKANVEYSKVLRRIEPLNSELKKFEKQLLSSTQSMNEVQTELNTVNEHIATLKCNFGKITSETELLKSSLKQVQDTLEKAQLLILKLADEKLRWQEQVQQMESFAEDIPKHCLMSSAFIHILVDFRCACPEDERAQSIQEWRKCIWNDNASNMQGSSVKQDVLHFMVGSNDQMLWKSQGLPDYQLAYENAMIMLQTHLFPIIVDPNAEAKQWLVNYLGQGDRPLEVIQYGGSKFVKTLELSVRFGKTLLILDVEEIEPFLYPLLKRQTQRHGASDNGVSGGSLGRPVICIGETVVDFNEQSFRLYPLEKESETSWKHIRSMSERTQSISPIADAIWLELCHKVTTKLNSMTAKRVVRPKVKKFTVQSAFGTREPNINEILSKKKRQIPVLVAVFVFLTLLELRKS